MKAIIGFGLITAALVYAAWSWVFQTGLYAILVRWQAAIFDTYFPSITFAVIFLGLLVPIALFEKLLGVGGKKQGDMEISLDDLKARLAKRLRGFLIAAMILVGAAIAAFFAGQKAPDDQQLAVAIDLNNYEPQNYWFKKISLNGVLLNKSSYSIISKSNRRGGESETRYTPIASPGKAKKPIHFVHIKTSNHKLRINPQLAMSGFVRPSVLPVLVRDTFEADGLMLADRVHVIGDSVVSPQMGLYIATGILGLIAFFMLVSAAMMPIQRRRLVSQWQIVNGQVD